MELWIVALYVCVGAASPDIQQFGGLNYQHKFSFVAYYQQKFRSVVYNYQYKFCSVTYYQQKFRSVVYTYQYKFRSVTYYQQKFRSVVYNYQYKFRSVTYDQRKFRSVVYIRGLSHYMCVSQLHRETLISSEDRFRSVVYYQHKLLLWCRSVACRLVTLYVCVGRVAALAVRAPGKPDQAICSGTLDDRVLRQRVL